ncbi:DEAD/DEAH box helicase [Phenylobacterium sp. VNQ135]|uniref:DEAD/DEAH box helicase n=1 Tax=Phenylobacterium sp. VNQ135 TaxID=3400922 RepID=UPI003C073E43
MDRDPGTDERAEAAHVDAALAPSPAAAPEAEPPREARQAPAAWCAQAVIAPAREAGADGLIYVASSDRRAEEIGRALRHFAPDIEVLVLPAWDCLPYDRASPSRDVMGRRMAVLARLRDEPDGPRVLVTPAEALLQRAPPEGPLRSAFFQVRQGERLDRDTLQAFAARTGYVVDDRIDEPGEIALLGLVADVYPAAADAPIRLTLDEDDRIVEIKRYDPLTQRTEASVDCALLGPASELILDEPGQERQPGAEHRAPLTYGRMADLLDAAPRARLVFDAKADQRALDFLDQVGEAYDARRQLAQDEAGEILPPDSLYLTRKAYRAAIARRAVLEIETVAVEATPRFAVERSPGRAFSDYVGRALAEGFRVALTGLPHELRPLSRAMKRGLDQVPAPAADWAALMAAPPGALLSMPADIDAGFRDAALGVVVVAAPDVLGGRVAVRSDAAAAADPFNDPDLRVGDVVIHEDHGVGVLSALERVEVDGAERDALRLEYHGGASLLAPVEEFGRIWRYGAEREAVALDRLHTDAWTKRRAELSADIDRTAEHLVELARRRRETPGLVVRPPKPAYARLAARFPYPETPDQAGAIEAVLEDLASGRMMNRLVCGDVGFGKTEVALRAASAAALSGVQVALVAPTTVLARQHYDSVRRRFAGTDIKVARLSRLASPKEAAEVKVGLADGSIQVVVGTHALAGKDVAFKNLGLLIIDEEQRFGAALKQRLRDLAPEAHLLTMTATPIPRTLQLAMVGIEDVSVIATPPARRRPIRTFLAAYDAATVRTALLRERRRAGQSFVVAPRIEDLGPLAEELQRLVPELSVQIVHGELPPEEADEVMVRFAAGHGDVLLATNIIESGLDVPRANTMLVVRADLFGLAQLHQLRGRVGRGRAQGIAYLFHAPETELPEVTRARLSTLEAFDRLGSGLAISARDLELRGAGDLLGDEQAGHVKLIGTALYQRLLSRAVRVAKGEIAGPEWTPQLNVGVTGAISESYVPDPTVRINLYARLARLASGDDVDAFAEELEDRFGAVPEETQILLDLARIHALALAAGIGKIDAGPKAIAFTPAPGAPRKALAKAGLEASGDRVLWRGEVPEARARLGRIISLLEALA